MEIFENLLKGSSMKIKVILTAYLQHKQQKRPNRLESWEVKRSSSRLKQTEENTFPSKRIIQFRNLLPQVIVKAKTINVLKWHWPSSWKIHYSSKERCSGTFDLTYTL